jgi:hypothetical protein
MSDTKKTSDIQPEPNKNPALGRGDLVPSEVIPTSLDTALRSVGIDPKDPNISRAVEISLTMMFSGSLPLAPPPILREYGNIKPELVDKLVEWTEEQGKHRRALEKLRTEGSETRLDRGQYIGAAVAIGGLCLASAVGIFGNMWVGMVIAIVAIGGPTAAIILAQNFNKQSNAQPKSAKPPPMDSVKS